MNAYKIPRATDYTLVVSVDTATVDIDSLITALGWDGVTDVKVQLIINQGIKAGTITFVAASGQLHIVNNGSIYGAKDGGHAISVPNAILIVDNFGLIAGGGGAGFDTYDTVLEITTPAGVGAGYPGDVATGNGGDFGQQGGNSTYISNQVMLAAPGAGGKAVNAAHLSRLDNMGIIKGNIA